MDRAVSLEARRIELAVEPPFRLGSAKVDPPAHEVSWPGHNRGIQPQVLKVLIALHDRSGEVVSRDELVDRCWDGRIVGQDVINRCASILRRLASECGEFEIQTVPRGGYRLVESMPARPIPAKLAARRISPWILCGAVAVIIAAIGISYYVLRGRPDASDAIVRIDLLSAAANDPPARALSQGLASSIERDLAGSRTPVQLVESATKGESLILRGKTINDRGTLRASVELIFSRTGDILWAANFDGPLSKLDLLRERLSLQVGRELHCAYADGSNAYFDHDLEFARLRLAHCDALGYDPRQDALRFDDQITRGWPGFARGWAEYSMDTSVLSEVLPLASRPAAYQRAIAFARRALTLDPHQGLAYTGWGHAIAGTASWQAQESLARRALAADPQSPEVHNWQSGLLVDVGRLQDGLSEARISYQLDHFLPGKIDQLIWINIDAGNLDDAQDYLALARRNWPDNQWFNYAAVQLGEGGRSPTKALQLVTSRQARYGDSVQRELEPFLRWRIEPTGETRRAAIEAIETEARMDGPTNEQVQLLAVLGNLNAAYALAARTTSSTTGDLGWFNPELAAFRADPRFMPFAARLGLAQIWLNTGHWPDFCSEGGNLQACRIAAAEAVRRIRQAE